MYTLLPTFNISYVETFVCESGRFYSIFFLVSFMIKNLSSGNGSLMSHGYIELSWDKCGKHVCISVPVTLALGIGGFLPY